MAEIQIYPELPFARFTASKLIQKSASIDRGRLLNSAATRRSNIMWIYMTWVVSIVYSRRRYWNLGVII